MSEPEVEREDAAEARDYLKVVRERAWIIILTVVIIVGTTVALSYQSKPKYLASSTLVYEKSNLDQALFGTAVFPDTNPALAVQTDAGLVKINEVASAVKTQLKSNKSTQELLAAISVKSSNTSTAIQIDAVSSDPNDAASLANAFALQFIVARQNADKATVETARQLVKNQLDGLSLADANSTYGSALKDRYESLQIIEAMQNGGFTVAQPAVAPAAPFSPRPLRNGILALLVGLMLGLGLAFLLEYRDSRIKDERTLETCYNTPVLASVPALPRKWRASKKRRKSKHLVGFACNPSLLEPFRALRSTLQYFAVDRTMTSILVTSGLSREGKTMTTVNLALALALAGKRVVILEADLRRPMVTEYLSLKNEVGLSTVLSGKATVKDAMQFVGIEPFVPPSKEGGENRVEEAEKAQKLKKLYCIASGPLPPNPAELLSSGRMEALIHQLSEAADYLIIDSPPVLAVADALALASYADAVLLTARINSTKREEAREVSKLLSHVGAHVIGLVAVGAKTKGSYYRSAAYA